MGHAHAAGAAFSAVALAGAAVALGAYLAAAREQRARGRRWGPGRTAAFASGVGLVALAVAPPVVGWAHGDLRGHMAQHLLLGMLAPLGLVLGAPVTLALRTLPVRAARRLAGALKSGPARALSHPASALVLNVGGMAALYATPLYAATQASPLLHALVHVHFLAAGYVFAWAVLAGPDPAPHAPGLGVRLGVLFVAVAAHAVLAKLMYGYGLPRGTAHGPDEIRAAARLMYYGGDLAEGLLAGALFGRWYRSRRAAGERGTGPAARPASPALGVRPVAARAPDS